MSSEHLDTLNSYIIPLLLSIIAQTELNVNGLKVNKLPQIFSVAAYFVYAIHFCEDIRHLWYNAAI